MMGPTGDRDVTFHLTWLPEWSTVGSMSGRFPFTCRMPKVISFSGSLGKIENLYAPVFKLEMSVEERKQTHLRTLRWTYEPGRRSEGTGWIWAHSRLSSQFPHWRWVRQISRNSPGTQQTWTTTRWNTAPGPARLLQKPGQWRNTRTRRLLPAAPWNTTLSHRCWAFISIELMQRRYVTLTAAVPLRSCGG